MSMLRFLVDTHLLLWSADTAQRLSPSARAILGNPEHTLYFSSATIWEIVVKRALNRPDFTYDAEDVRSSLLLNGYSELPFTGKHALRIANLPRLHKDPFDRILIAQAFEEDMTLVTSDQTVAEYSARILLV